MGANFEIFSFIISILVLTYLIYKIYKFHTNYQYVDTIISDHYENEEMYVEGISKLNLSEKIKYGVPVSSIFTLYWNSFGLINPESRFVRKVELIDEEKNTYTKYVELIIDNETLSSFNEFDSYDI